MWLMTPEEDSVEAVPFRFLISLGGWFAFAQVASVVFGVIGYFAWPYAFSKNDATAILEGIQRSPAAYFMKLDPVVLFGTLLQFPVWLGLWSALRRSDPAKSVLALSLGGGLHHSDPAHQTNTGDVLPFLAVRLSRHH